MRNLIIAAVGFASAACSGAAAKVDTAALGDSNVVAGSPATTTSPPAAESAKTPLKKPAQPPASRPDAGGNTPAVAAKVDSVRGVVSVVGTSFDKHVMIADRGGQRRVEVVGSLSGLIGHVSGAEV